MDIDSPANYSGAIIFWSYILAALFFTFTIIRTIYHDRITNQQKIPIFLTILAISSFSTLSYHMLNVLILSYKQWATYHNIPLPTSLFGPGSYVGPHRTPLFLWKWSTTSSLFQDFGEAIVASDPKYLWASAGLWTTLYMSPFMAIEGRNAKIPNLWAFFGLLEILPTSFSQTLCYIMLSITPRRPRSQRSPHPKILWYAVGVAYALCLYTAASSTGTTLIKIILAARLLLLLPLILPLSTHKRTSGNSGSKDLYNFCALIAQTFVGYRGVMVVREHGISSIFQALQSHPAVKTLGFDLLHSVVAFLYWRRSRDAEVFSIHQKMK